jgi:DNA polymerase
MPRCAAAVLHFLIGMPARESPRKTGFPTAEPFLPPADERKSIARLHECAEGCRGCPLYRRATQVVFGEGPRSARLLIVGEQPGDQEDLAGRPFVGPSGKLLDRALDEVGVDRDEVYVTNAVKHFKWEARGSRRLHSTPRTSEIKACRPWLRTELEAVRPEVVLCLGATAALSVFGRATPVLANRGKWLESEWAPRVAITVHPSAILRSPSSAEREAAFEAFVRDLRFAWKGATRAASRGFPPRIAKPPKARGLHEQRTR